MKQIKESEAAEKNAADELSADERGKFSAAAGTESVTSTTTLSSGSDYGSSTVNSDSGSASGRSGHGSGGSGIGGTTSVTTSAAVEVDTKASLIAAATATTTASATTTAATATVAVSDPDDPRGVAEAKLAGDPDFVDLMQNPRMAEIMEVIMSNDESTVNEILQRRFGDDVQSVALVQQWNELLARHGLQDGVQEPESSQAEIMAPAPEAEGTYIINLANNSTSSVLSQYQLSSSS